MDSSNNSSNDLILITLASTESGLSESIQIPSKSTPMSELLSLARAFFNLNGDIAIFKDGRAIARSTAAPAEIGTTAHNAGIRNGDVLAIQQQQQRQQQPPRPAPQSEVITPSTLGLNVPRQIGVSGGSSNIGSGSRSAAASGGLDFSNLLASVGGAVNETIHGGGAGGRISTTRSAAIAPAPAAATGGGGGLDFSNLIAAQTAKDALHNVLHNNNNTAAGSAAGTNSTSTSPIVYYPGMNLNEAMEHNPNPTTIVTMLDQYDHLLKELNYHNPTLAAKLRTAFATTTDHDKKITHAVSVWREEMFRGGMQHALSKNMRQKKEQQFRARLTQNPNDTEAKSYFEEQERAIRVEEQYRQMMQEFPESLGRVLMLYVNAKINGHSIQAFVDSGAQATIMSKSTAKECGLLDYLDTRFAGTAVGVGTGTILGRIHIVQLQLGSTKNEYQYHFPCTVTVMDDSKSDGSKMDFLLGLDMLKRHTCSIDLENQVLRFRLEPGKYMETPFLHEKDLDESKGGTKGFDAEKSNLELEKQMLLEEQKQDEQKQPAKDDDKKDDKSEKSGTSNNDNKQNKR